MSLGPEAVFAAQLYQMPEVLEDFPFKIPFLDEVPMYRIAGGSVRTATTPKFDPANFANIVPYCDEITDRTRLPEGREHQFAELGTSYEICYTAQDPESYPNDQDNEQAKLAKRTLLYKYCQMYDTGIAGPGSFDGLAIQVDPTKIVNAAALTASLAQWQRFRIIVDTNNGFNPIIMGNEDAYLAFLAANNIFGFNPDFVDYPCPDGRGGSTETRLACLEGAKFLLNNCIPNRIAPNGNTVTNVYCMQLGAAGGNQGGVFGIIPAGRPSWITRRETIIPGKSRIYVDYTLTAGLVVASKGSLSMLKDLAVSEAPPPPAALASARRASKKARHA